MKYLVVSLGIVTALMTSVSRAATPADTARLLADVMLP